MTREHILMITGRLAEHALRDMLSRLAPRIGFEYTVQVLPITVAALMTPAWVARHIRPVPEATKVLLPGYCTGELDAVAQATGLPVELGPRDLRRLPEYFGQPDDHSTYGRYDIEILAEINHAPSRAINDVVAEALRLKADGADVIDVGCDPGATWNGVENCVRALRAEGLRVSIDSFNPDEVEAAVGAGAELVLSVNASNRAAARGWGCEVVVVPDDLPTLGGLDETIEMLAQSGVRMRVDPVIEPIDRSAADLPLV
jgi:hypothetical protein